MSTPVIFLDIDGVLNDESWLRAVIARYPGAFRWSIELAQELLDPIRCARVQRICDATGAAIVIVSGWRRHAPAADIARLLANRGLTAPVIGAVGGVRFSGDTRDDATAEWLHNHPEVTRYVVIDDDALAWGSEWIKRWVRPVDGIGDEHVPRAIVILGESILPTAPTLASIARAHGVNPVTYRHRIRVSHMTPEEAARPALTLAQCGRLGGLASAHARSNRKEP